MKVKYLYFIIPLLAAIILAAVMFIKGTGRTLFPYVFLILFVSIIVWTVIIFNALYKEYTCYKDYANSEFKRAELAKDPKRFHLSVLYIMASMLHAQDKGHPVEKMSIMVRYILDVVPKEYRKQAVDTLDFLTQRVKGSGKKRETFSVINKKSILAYKEEDNANEIIPLNEKLKDSQSENNFFNNYANQGFILNAISGWRMAEELAKYISETDRLYIMYILFNMAVADNNVTTGSHSEAEMLNELCVKGMKLPTEALKEIYDEWQSGNLDHWYSTHIACKGNYPAPNVMADLFRNNAANQLFSLETKAAPTSNLANVKTFMEGEIIATLTVLPLNYFIKHLMCSFYPTWVILGLFFILGIVALSVRSLLLIPHSSILHVLRTTYEDHIQPKSLKSYFALSTLITLLCWYSTMNSLLIAANYIYYRKEFTRESTITGRFTEYSTRNRHTSYYLNLSPVSVADVNVDDYLLPHTSTKEKAIIYALPYLSGYKLLGSSKNDDILNHLSVDHSTYEETKVGSRIKLRFKVGYYGMIYSWGYKIEE